MTTDIYGIAAGTGKITFTVETNADGCNEIFSTIIDGTRFPSLQIKLVGAGPHAGQSISTNPKSGPRDIVVTAETSKFDSDSYPVVLIAAKGAGD